MILDESLKENEFKMYRDLSNGWVEDIDTNKILIEQLREENKRLKEKIDNAIDKLYEIPIAPIGYSNLLNYCRELLFLLKKGDSNE